MSIFLYFIFLISSIPANTVVSFLYLPTTINMSSVSGTIWSGQIKNLIISSVNLGSVTWNVQPLNLLFAELSADVSIVKNKQFIKSKVKLSPSGKIKLEETRFFINLSSLQPLTYGMPFSYTGTVEGTFSKMLLDKNKHIEIKGQLFLTGLTLVSPQKQLFGDFMVDFKPKGKGGTAAKIKDVGGPLQLDGVLTLTKDGRANLLAELSSSERSGSLEQMISILGVRNSKNKIELKNNFQFW